jgi:hypothetical protein
MPLVMDFSRKNLNAGDPYLAVLGSGAICRSELTCFDARARQAVSKRLRCVVPHYQRLLRFRGESLPKLFVERRHEENCSALFA